jgi:hypothetical protein
VSAPLRAGRAVRFVVVVLFGGRGWVGTADGGADGSVRVVAVGLDGAGASVRCRWRRWKSRSDGGHANPVGRDVSSVHLGWFWMVGSVR